MIYQYWQVETIDGLNWRFATLAQAQAFAQLEGGTAPQFKEVNI